MIILQPGGDNWLMVDTEDRPLTRLARSNRELTNPTTSGEIPDSAAGTTQATVVKINAGVISMAILHY